MYLRGKAPLRVSFCGGGTDVSPYPENHGGVVLSTTINKYAYGTIRPREDGWMLLYSLDYDSLLKIRVGDSPQFDGNLDLFKASIRYLHPKRGFDLFVHCDVPPGSGMGSSGTMASLLVGLISMHERLSLSNYEIADSAFKIERDELELLGGRQDEYAAVFGGFNLIEFYGDRTVVNPLRIEDWILKELEYHLILCYTRKTHFSGKLIEAHVRYYQNGRKDTIEGLHELKRLTFKMKEALLLGELGRFAKLLHVSGMAKKKMNPGVTDPYIDELYSIAVKTGAIGGKILGAGGGGYLLLYCHFDKKHKVVEALQNEGARIMPFSFDSKGLDIWVVHDRTTFDKFRLDIEYEEIHPRRKVPKMS